MSRKSRRTFKDTYACPVTNKTEHVVITEETTTILLTGLAGGSESCVLKILDNCSGIEGCGVRTRHSELSYNNDWSRCPLNTILKTKP